MWLVSVGLELGAAVAVAAAACLVVLGLLSDQRIGRQQEACNARSVLQGATTDLGRVDDAGGDEVAVLAGLSVVAERPLTLFDLLDDDRAFFARVGDDLAEGFLDGATDDVNTEALLSLDLELVERLLRADESDAATGDDAARVACSASSTRAFFSFISVSVAAPTLMTATPPTSLARRSWSFSRS